MIAVEIGCNSLSMMLMVGIDEVDSSVLSWLRGPNVRS